MFKDKTERTPIIQETFRQAEKIGPDMQDAVVPVWRDSSDGGRTLIGTAFFAKNDGRSFLITALHNFKRKPYVNLKIEFLGTTWALNEMSELISEEDDLWAGEANADLHQQLQTIRVPSLPHADPAHCRMSTGSVLMGYPEDLNLQGSPFRPLAISTVLETRDLTTTSPLPEPVIYHANDDFLTTVEGSVVMERPHIFGMSGGPVFGWFCSKAPGSDEIKLHHFLQGVIVSWQQRDGYVVACNAACVAALVKRSSAT